LRILSILRYNLIADNLKSVEWCIYNKIDKLINNLFIIFL
jgi:hypothetical protein